MVAVLAFPGGLGSWPELMHAHTPPAAAYRTAMELDPSNQKAKYGLGKMLNGAGRAAEGEALMAAAISADPEASEDYESRPLLEVRVSDQARR
jgi:cytochrome c-type biogenesis protein CcmH/NrfG